MKGHRSPIATLLLANVAAVAIVHAQPAGAGSTAAHSAGEAQPHTFLQEPDQRFRSAMMDMAVVRDEEKMIKDRAARIEAELKALDREALKDTDWAKEWAGVYYEGDGLGTNVTIRVAPSSGVAFLNYGCMGLYGGDHGEIVEALPEGLRLKLALGTAKNSYLSERVYFVKWGDQRFLVPDWLMAKFINNYNRGGYHRRQMYGIPRFKKDGEHTFTFDAPVPKGTPQLPAEFAKLLRWKPIDLKVTRVSDVTTTQMMESVSRRHCTIEFEGGSDCGVYAGMEFAYPKPPAFGETDIRITSVTPKTSIGVASTWTSSKDAMPLPAIGEIVSTSDDSVEPKEPLAADPPTADPPAAGEASPTPPK